MAKKIESIILIMVAIGIVAATSLSGWMNKKAEAAPALSAQPPSAIVPPQKPSPSNNYYYYAPPDPTDERPVLQPI